MLDIGRSIYKRKDNIFVPDHVCTALLKSVYKATMEHSSMWKRVMKLKRFRSNSNFAPHYIVVMIMTAMGIVKAPPLDHRYVFIPLAEQKRRISTYVPAPHLFCINDRVTKEDRVYLEKLLKDEL
jgi:hypothetical protein